MDLTSILAEALGSGLVAPLVSLVVLPIVYRLVGISKKERREREAQSLRMDMDLARGLHELAEMSPDGESRRAYLDMRAHVMADFLDKARRHFDQEQRLRRDPTSRYLLLPRPRGLFGVIWSIIVVTLTAIALMLIVAVAASVTQATTTPSAAIFAVAIIILAFAAPVLLFRWFAFVSARRGLPRAGQSQAQSMG